MIAYDEALAIVTAAARPLGREGIALTDARGRFLAEPVVAAVDAPPADVSAMDGYAVSGLGPYRVVGASYPGLAFGGGIGPGECVRVFTGGAVPEGTDRVLMQEVVGRDGDLARATGELSGDEFIRRRGADFARGQQLLEVGDRMTPAALVAAAGADLDRVVVGRRPRVAILATGDELVPPGEARMRAGSIPESVSIGLAALISDHGGEAGPAVLVPDDRAETIRAARLALADADLVVTVGGASVGERDFAQSAFAEVGLELCFSGVAMRPGKPVWMGTAGTKSVLGLPGNPTSAYVTSRLLLAPLVRGLAGGRPDEAVRWMDAVLGSGLPPCGARETFIRGAWRDGTVEALAYQDSGAQLTLARSDLLIRRPAAAGPLAAGAPIRVLPL